MEKNVYVQLSQYDFLHKNSLMLHITLSMLFLRIVAPSLYRAALAQTEFQGMLWT